MEKGNAHAAESKKDVCIYSLGWSINWISACREDGENRLGFPKTNVQI